MMLDIEDSTGIHRRLGRFKTLGLLDAYDKLLRDVVKPHGGSVLEADKGDDGRTVLFSSPVSALTAACELMLRIERHEWREQVRVRVRCGVHTADTAEVVGLEESEDIAGVPVILTVRLCDSASPGQIVLSADTSSMVGRISNKPFGVIKLGRIVPKGFEDEPPVVYQVVHSELRSEFPPLPGQLGVPPTNIDQPRTSFVGREQEFEQLRKALESSKLVMLLGPGGAGKTRLALEAGLAHRADYEDGVWFVALDALPDDASEQQIWQLIADALRVHVSEKDSIEASVMSRSRDRDVLLILDNCEHVLSSVAVVADRWLDKARGSLLATSRERLGVAGEAMVPVSALTLPDPKKESFDQIRQSAAVELFVARAKNVLPGFELDEESAADVGRICQLLDGNPLAIELTVPNIRTMLPDKILEYLEKRKGGWLRWRSPRHDPRHRSLEVAIEWGYRLLGPSEQVLFTRLGTFASGFTLEDVEAVCAFAPLQDEDVIALVGALESKSMISATLGRRSPRRFRMLESLRRFALEKQEEQGAEKEMADRHLSHYHALAVRAEDELLGEDQKAWLDDLDQMLANLRRALRHAQQSGRIDDGISIVTATWRYWQLRGRVTEGRAALVRLMAVEGVTVSLATQADAFRVAGTLAFYQGDMREATLNLREAIHLERRRGSSKGLARAVNNLGVVLQTHEDLAGAQHHFEEAAILFEKLDDQEHLKTTLVNLGMLARLQTDFDQASVYLVDGLERATRLGDWTDVASCNLYIGYVNADTGRLDEAEDRLQDSLGMVREMGNRWGESECELALGYVAWLADDLPSAIEHHRRCIQIAEEIEDRWVETTSRLHLSMILGCMEQFDDAYHELQVCRTRDEILASPGQRISHGLAQSVYALGIGRANQAHGYLQVVIATTMTHRLYQHAVAALEWVLVYLAQRQDSEAFEMIRSITDGWRASVGSFEAPSSRSLRAKLISGSGVVLETDATHLVPAAARKAAIDSALDMAARALGMSESRTKQAG